MAFAIIVTIIGFLLLLDKMGVVTSVVWGYVWPLVIIFIGLSMVYHKVHCGCYSFIHEEKHSHPRSKRGTSVHK